MIDDGRAWHRRADELAEFTMLHLPNRVDVWGSYLPVNARSVRDDGTVDSTRTAPAIANRGRQHLDARTVARHYRGYDGSCIGLHTTSPANTSRFLVFDLDNHETLATVAAENETGCEQLTSLLRAFGLAPLVEDSDGCGGRHVWIIFHQPVSTARVHAFAGAVVAELELSAETFPKQPAIDAGKFGNWVRLPGRHHTRDHWSRFLADGEWHAGDDAVELWLCAWLSSGEHIPELPRRPATSALAPRNDRSWGPRSIAGTERAIASYMAKLPTGLGVGDGRNHAGYRFACFLVRNLALSDHDALSALAEWNARQRVPYPERKLLALIGDAHHYGRSPIGGAA